MEETQATMHIAGVDPPDKPSSRSNWILRLQSSAPAGPRRTRQSDCADERWCRRRNRSNLWGRDTVPENQEESPAVQATDTSSEEVFRLPPYSTFQDQQDPKNHRNCEGLASLLTPVICMRRYKGASSTNMDKDRIQREDIQKGEVFVHEESVISKPNYNRGLKNEWINRWSDDNTVYVPSAAAMAIVGKSSFDLHSNSSWSNSVTAWQDDGHRFGSSFP